MTLSTLDFLRFTTGGAITDASSNEELKFVSTATAVNEFTITNAATGNRPKLKSTGGDTNVGMTIETQGTGQILFVANAVTQLTIDPAVTTFNAQNVQFAGQFQYVTGGSAGSPNMFLNTSPFPGFYFATSNGGTIAFSGNASGAHLVISTNNGVVAGLPVVLPTYTVGTLPSAATFARGLIYVSDGTGNKRLAISDGAAWRFPDGNVVS